MTLVKYIEWSVANTFLECTAKGYNWSKISLGETWRSAYYATSPLIEVQKWMQSTQEQMKTTAQFMKWSDWWGAVRWVTTTSV
jgi:hypothetical protein